MKTVTFKSASETKLNLLKQIAKEMGVKTQTFTELTDEEMALPGSKPSKKQLENWLAKEDGERYSMNDAFKVVKTELRKSRRKNK